MIRIQQISSGKIGMIIAVNNHGYALIQFDNEKVEASPNVLLTDFHEVCESDCNDCVNETIDCECSGG